MSLEKPSADLESQPFLPVPAAALLDSGCKVAPRKWRGTWWNIFGECTPSDVTALVLAVKMPCIAWGWNQNRTLGFSFLKEILRFIGLTVGLGVGIHLSCCATMMMLCPQALPPHPEDDGPHPNPHGPKHGGPASIESGDKKHGPPEIPEECLARLTPAFIAVAAASIALFICVALFFARRRSAIRERFGIEGSTKEDQLLYVFCAPCALTQETRTLMHEQVHEGVWYGALPGVVSPTTQIMAA
ncbi:hypothetical protein CEUSTIGMA_g7976.t1 [Chlamydomonas eustigma]|uniref:Uncharacterized protein n=1 Tax=Chlamydomonas eustigma TaxID=1157962 RepID=A0A250XBS5_9CHLO|nr:hypothetical protein CEUSTIGMA_g7976.t1 [Chlamydomonas eustigma]|eukprot:GAX80538.1 hypothetical protein CEUSTIGMA_g7976.t1 [Chlamydomonas eustigma]